MGGMVKYITTFWGKVVGEIRRDGKIYSPEGKKIGYIGESRYGMMEWEGKMQFIRLIGNVKRDVTFRFSCIYEVT